MKEAGYTNPIRSMERKLAPDYASREFRDPGLRTTRQSAGLGSLKHTMPHLQRNLRLAGGGGLSNPVGEIAAAGHPNLYNPDPEFRQFLQLASQPAFTARDLIHAPSPRAEFVYQDGGDVQDEEGQEGPPPDMGEVQQPDDQMSAPDQQEREIVLNAMAALEGQSPDPGADLQAFIKAFGPRALADLQQLVEQKHQQTQDPGEGEEEGEMEGEPEGSPAGGAGQDQDQDQDQELAQAGGGLLHGKGTGQSDEIEGTTPSGRPVLLSDGEYVIDAPTVAALGDGSTKAGARRLDDLRKQIRRDAYGHDKQAKPMKKKGGGVTVVLK